MSRDKGEGRVANLALGLMRRNNDTLDAVDAAELARKFRLPEYFVAAMIAEEWARRNRDAS